MEEREKSGMKFDDFLGQLAVFRQVRMSTNMKSFGDKNHIRLMVKTVQISEVQIRSIVDGFNLDWRNYSKMSSSKVKMMPKESYKVYIVCG